MALNNYPYYWSQPALRPQEQAQPQFGIKGRPVSSIDEVRATSIDFDGSVFYFPDLANKKIYTKQINFDGTSTLNVYELKPIPVEPIFNPSKYVTREEFETVIQKLLGAAGAQVQSAPQVAQPTQKPSPPAPQEVGQTPAAPTAPQNFNF